MNMAEYRELITEFLPAPIHDLGQLERTEAIIDSLLARNKRTAAQDAYLELLSLLVAAWEDANVTIPPLSGRELLATLIEERGLRNKDLLPVFSHESIVSEILSGKRQLKAKHIAGLAKFFHVSPAAFMPADSVAERELAAVH